MPATPADAPARPVRILAGGRSTEHDASVHSCLQVLRDLEAGSGHGLRLTALYYLDRAGQPCVHRPPGWPRTPRELAQGRPLTRVGLLEELSRGGEYIFNLLHGNEGEDGAWQGVAEVLDLPGSFGPVAAAALTMDKWAQSLVAVGACGGELRMPRTWRVDAPLRDGAVERIAAELAGLPAVVKPNRMGASHLARRLDPATGELLARAAEEIFVYDPQALVQEYVEGREYTCGCIERGGEVVALPVVEAVTADGFLGHDEKHRAGRVTPRLFLADDGETARVKEASRQLFAAFGLEGMCRFDFIARADGLYFLEANSIPGLMGGSVFPRMLQAAGLDRADLIACCMDAYARRPAREKRLCYEVHRE